MPYNVGQDGQADGTVVIFQFLVLSGGCVSIFQPIL